jgi:acetyl-CoA C-acetyltransferase
VAGEGPEIDMSRIISSGAAPSGLAWRVNELIFGNARPAGVGPNPARQIAWRAGLGDDVPAFTINMACASGLRSVMLGWQQIAAGDAEIVVAGGAESMSRAPYLVEARWGFRMGNQPLIDSMYRDGFQCQISKMVMGDTAEVLAGKYQISREEQDLFALESHHRAARATTAGAFNAEIVPIERTDKKGKVTRIESDEHIRSDVTLEALAKLPPVFAAAGGAAGTVTAGSASGITDGAAAIVLVSEEKLRSLKLTPLARIVDAAVAGVDPRVMGIGPVPAVRKLMARTGRTSVSDYGAVELNEAFAAQVLACDRELHFDHARLNPNGGAIALGHPIACSGARMLTTLVHHLRQPGRSKGVGNKVNRGLATLCVSGGFGVAMEIEAF